MQGRDRADGRMSILVCSSVYSSNLGMNAKTLDLNYNLNEDHQMWGLIITFPTIDPPFLNNYSKSSLKFYIFLIVTNKSICLNCSKTILNLKYSRQLEVREH